MREEELCQALLPSMPKGKNSLLGKDLFLDALIKDCFVCEGSSSPVDTAFFRVLLLADAPQFPDAQVRQQVFFELLEKPDAKRGLENSIKSLTELRVRLSTEEHALNVQSGLTRRVEILH